MVPTETGGAVDDAYLYRFVDGEYLLVVNASNRHKDWDHFRDAPRALPRRGDERRDRRDRHGGPAGQGVPRDPRRAHRERRPAGAAAQRAERGHAAAAGRRTPRGGAHRAHRLHGRARRVRALRRRRTTGRRCGTRWSPRAPCPSASAPATPCVWRPACRSTATSSASTRRASRSPSSAARWRRSRSASRRARATSSAVIALERQQKAYARILQRDYSLLDDLPRLTRPVAVTGRGIAREGAPVHAEQGAGRFGGETLLGWVTSGTAVPYWGSRRRRPLLPADRAPRAALHRARLPRQPGARRRRGRDWTSAAVASPGLSSRTT